MVSGLVKWHYILPIAQRDSLLEYAGYSPFYLLKLYNGKVNKNIGYFPGQSIDAP